MSCVSLGSVFWETHRYTSPSLCPGLNTEVDETRPFSEVTLFTSRRVYTNTKHLFYFSLLTFVCHTHHKKTGLSWQLSHFRPTQFFRLQRPQSHRKTKSLAPRTGSETFVLTSYTFWPELYLLRRR